MKCSLSLYLSEQLSKKGGLGCRSAESGAGRGLVSAFLIETQARGVNLEQTFGRRPVFAFAAHAFTKHARVEFSTTRFANSVHHAVGFGGQLFAQTFFEIRRDVTGQSQHVDERVLSASVLRTLQKHRDIGR